MKTFSALTLGMLFSLSFPTQSGAAPQLGAREPQRIELPKFQLSQGACVYDRPNYKGREQCWNVGQDLSDLGRFYNWSGKISSIRVFGFTTVVLYRDIQYRGESIVIDQDVPNLARVSARAFRNWDHQASSIQIDPVRGDFRDSPVRRYERR
jgi:hypothetical protein